MTALELKYNYSKTAMRHMVALVEPEAFKGSGIQNLDCRSETPAMLIHLDLSLGAHFTSSCCCSARR